MGLKEWITPRRYIDMAREVMGDIDLDPASSSAAQINVGAALYYGPRDGSLDRPWRGRVWLAPPTGRGQMAAFTEKLIRSYYEGGTVAEAVILCPNWTDTGWFHHMMDMARMWVFMQGRVKFETPAGGSGTPPNGQVFFYLGARPERFLQVFGPLGISVENCPEADIIGADAWSYPTPRDWWQVYGARPRMKEAA